MVFAALGLLLLSPLLVLLILLSKAAGGGPVFYGQKRVGLGGREFTIWKFRSMVAGADKIGPLLTKDGDLRITPLGRLLRKTKLDELPQLWNVLRGDMSLVGPRPEVPRYVAHYSEAQREVLRWKPGITDPATLAFREEELLLSQAADSEQFYLDYCLPRKIQLNQDYARRANLRADTWVIVQTLWSLARAGAPGPGLVDSIAQEKSGRRNLKPETRIK
jgi:lipopolysaccharide/colanic/teichoic acid biosynthesis glycosyltransferase